MTAPPRPSAPWPIRFRCGHRQRHHLRGVAVEDRAERALSISRGLCPRCRRIVDAARHPRRQR